jgi:thiol peroxidase
MSERTGVVTVQGNPVTLVGDEVKVGDKAPDFVALDNGLAPKSLADYAGKVVVISVVTSLDTSICDLQTRRFNQEAAALGEDVVILTVSMDLPFAQARFCGAAGIDQVVTLSDHRDASFGMNYGVLIKELRLLARSIVVLDKEGVIRYFQINSENAEDPDFDSALAAVKELV